MAGSGERRVLILFAHPAVRTSRVNRRLVAAVRGLAGVTIQDLYESYPELDIDVPREQALLRSHAAIVMQFPLFWYSTPAILKEWQDLVLEHGWAFGRDGVALRGKQLLCAITTGGGEAAYQPDGFNRYVLRDYLRPLEQMAHLCGLDFLPPFVVHGTHSVTAPEIEAHAVDYLSVVEALRDDRLDLEVMRRFPRLNSALSEVIRPRHERAGPDGAERGAGPEGGRRRDVDRGGRT